MTDTNETLKNADYEAYKSYLDLWKSENPIKTNKLQMLLTVNGLLVAAINVSAHGFSKSNWPFFMTGAVLSLIWILSIGRTCFFQKIWQKKIQIIKDKYPQDPRFQILETTEVEKEIGVWARALGGVSSKYYLLGAPLLFFFAWLGSLFYLLISAS